MGIIGGEPENPKGSASETSAPNPPPGPLKSLTLPAERTPSSKKSPSDNKKSSPDAAPPHKPKPSQENSTSKSALYVGSEDARKAFDVVNQFKLKKKLFATNLSMQAWSIIDDLYTGGSEEFRLGGQFSSPYTVLLGVKQGGINSPTYYKSFIFNLLEALRSNRMGLFIGCIYVGTPTVADDVLLLENRDLRLQGMLDVTYAYSQDNDYTLHPGKSLAAGLIKPRSQPAAPQSWKLGEDSIKDASSFTHLGLNWVVGRSYPDIDEIISNTRRTSYAFFGAGLHGQNGLDLCASLQIIQLYLKPVLTHGLAACVIPRKEVDKIETHFRKLLRMLQGLPDSTATCAVYLLSGQLPAEALIHARVLSLYGQITRLEQGHPLRELTRRQLGLRTTTKSSWFNLVCDIALTYHIDVHHALDFPMPRHSWRALYKHSIRTHWAQQLCLEALAKPSLRLILWNGNELEEPHGVWTSIKGKPTLVKAATTRARMMVQRYSIRGASWRTSDRSCQLCSHPAETLQHIIAECPRSSHLVEGKLEELQALYLAEKLPCPVSKSEILSAVINGDRFLRDGTGVGSQLSTCDSHLIKLQESAAEGHVKSSIICH